MIKFFKGLLQGSDDQQPGREEPAADYNGYLISPCPRNVGGGWSTEAIIRKELDGEIREHIFIRADTSSTRDSAITLIVSKAQTLIDQQGDRIFT